MKTAASITLLSHIIWAIVPLWNIHSLCLCAAAIGVFSIAESQLC